MVQTKVTGHTSILVTHLAEERPTVISDIMKEKIHLSSEILIIMLQITLSSLLGMTMSILNFRYYIFLYNVFRELYKDLDFMLVEQHLVLTQHQTLLIGLMMHLNYQEKLYQFL
jgi:hypothetical protein